jgi:hypothetical protein
MFDTRHWLTTHAAQAQEITCRTWFVVGGITLLWNLFERRHCARDADIDAIEDAVPATMNQPLPPTLVEAFSFWKARYVRNNDTNLLFDELNFRPSHRKAFVRSVLLDPLPAPRDQLTATLIIVYRLRNNLFHGEKDLPTLNEQFENLDVACKALAATMELLDSQAD